MSPLQIIIAGKIDKNSNFVGVWHMKESSGINIADSTSDGYSATKNGASSPTFTSSGQIDGAQSYNGSTDKVTGTNATNLNFGTNSFTVFLWVNKNPAAGTNDFDM